MLRLVPFFLFFDGYLKWFVVSTSLNDSGASVASENLILDWIDNTVNLLPAFPLASWLASCLHLLTAVSEVTVTTSSFIFSAIANQCLFSERSWLGLALSNSLSVVDDHLMGINLITVVHFGLVAILENLVYMIGVLCCLHFIHKICNIPLIKYENLFSHYLFLV
jgi:hypothetical protein